MKEKVFIGVLAYHDPEGNIHPQEITWTNGKRFSIDKVLDVRMAASLKVGGQGLRYTCRIHGKEVYLFCDTGQWFIES